MTRRGDPPAETLAAGDADAPRSRRVPLLLGLVLALVLAGAALDHRQRAAETDALLTATAAATGTARYADRRVLAVVQYTQPQLFAADTSEAVRADLTALVQAEAAALAPDVRAAADQVRDVRVLPWHSDHADARDTVVGLLRTRAASLARVADDSAALFTEDPALAPARSSARQALLAVVAGPDAVARVDRALDGT